MLRKRADIVRNGLFIIIEHNDQILLQAAGIVDGFQGHAASQRAIPNYRNNFEILPLQIPRGGQAKGSRNGRAGMARAKNIIGTLIPAEIAGESAKLANRMEA